MRTLFKSLALLVCLAAPPSTLSAAQPARASPPPLWVADGSRVIASIAASAVRHAESYATGGDGTSANPWTGWETAFASIPESGGRIHFARGSYTQNAPIKLPVGLTNWLAIVGGPDVTIKLTAAAPRFLDPDLSADHQSVRNIWIEGFAIDANGVGGKDHVIFGNYVNGSGVGGFRRVDWDRIVVKDVRAYDVPVDPTTASHRGGIAILSSQADDEEAVPDTITRVYIDNVRIEGGNWGILVDGGGAAGGHRANVRIDDVWLVRCWHSLLARQPRFASSNFQIGERARVGHAYVIDCYGQYSADTGLELNATAFAQVSGTVIEDANVADFYYVNYNAPESEAQVIFDRCEARITGPVQGGYGVGWWIKDVDPSLPPGGRFRIARSRFSRRGTDQGTGTGSGVTAEGRLSELSIAESQFELSGVELGGLPYGQRVIELGFDADVTFRLKNVEIHARARREKPGAGGLNAITTESRAEGKTLTLDWEDVAVSADVSGPPADYTVFTTTIVGNASSAVAGKIRGYRVDSVSGDPRARAINIDLAKQTIAGSLVIADVDARRLPAHGIAVQLNNPADPSEARKVSMRRIHKPATP